MYFHNENNGKAYEAGGKQADSSLHVILIGDSRNGRLNLENLQAERENKFMEIREKKCLPTINENSEDQSEFKNTFVASKMNLYQESPRSEAGHSDNINNYPNSYSDARPASSSLTPIQNSLPVRNRQNSFKKQQTNF